MNNEILYVLLDKFADHEYAFLTSAINCNEKGLRENPKYINKIVAPTMLPVCSCGGFKVVPDYSLDNLPDEYSALILVGGYGWLDDTITSKVAEIVKKAIGKGIIVGAICNGASFMAKYGFLNNVKHTGNGLDQLKMWGGNIYINEKGYLKEQAVSDKKIVTANGTGYLEFTKELLLLLENDTIENIDMYYRFNKLGFVEFLKQMGCN